MHPPAGHAPLTAATVHSGDMRMASRHDACSDQKGLKRDSDVAGAYSSFKSFPAVNTSRDKPEANTTDLIAFAPPDGDDDARCSTDSSACLISDHRRALMLLPGSRLMVMIQDDDDPDDTVTYLNAEGDDDDMFASSAEAKQTIKGGRWQSTKKTNT